MKRLPMASPAASEAAPAEDPAGPPREPFARRAVVEDEAYRRLLDVYAEVDRRIAAAGPRCDSRGVCCDFDRVDHVLYATKLEVDLIKDALPEERWQRPAGNVCPLLVDGRCTAREVRMLGCRTYFCEAGWEPKGAEIYEWAYRAIQEIVTEHGLEWRYAPALEQMREGR